MHNEGGSLVVPVTESGLGKNEERSFSMIRHVGQDGHKLTPALDGVSERCPAVDAVRVYDWGEECREEGACLRQLFLSVRQEAPVGTVATARRVLVDLGEHVLADGEIVADGILCGERQREKRKRERVFVSIYVCGQYRIHKSIHATINTK